MERNRPIRNNAVKRRPDVRGQMAKAAARRDDRAERIAERNEDKAERMAETKIHS